MLSKFFLRAGAAAVALTCAAGPASAENFQVLVLDYAFFPEISYVSPGDTITFTNVSGMTRSITAEDGQWEIPELTDGAEAILSVTQGMKNQYLTVAEGSAADGIEDETVVGILRFSAAPDADMN